MQTLRYAVLFVTLAGLPLRAQPAIDSSLFAYINGIKAIMLPPKTCA